MQRFIYTPGFPVLLMDFYFIVLLNKIMPCLNRLQKMFDIPKTNHQSTNEILSHLFGPLLPKTRNTVTADFIAAVIVHCRFEGGVEELRKLPVRTLADSTRSYLLSLQTADIPTFGVVRIGFAKLLRALKMEYPLSRVLRSTLTRGIRGRGILSQEFKIPVFTHSVTNQILEYLFGPLMPSRRAYCAYSGLRFIISLVHFCRFDNVHAIHSMDAGDWIQKFREYSSHLQKTPPLITVQVALTKLLRVLGVHCPRPIRRDILGRGYRKTCIDGACRTKMTAALISFASSDKQMLRCSTAQYQRNIQSIETLTVNLSRKFNLSLPHQLLDVTPQQMVKFLEKAGCPSQCVRIFVRFYESVIVDTSIDSNDIHKAALLASTASPSGIYTKILALVALGIASNFNVHSADDMCKLNVVEFREWLTENWGYKKWIMKALLRTRQKHMTSSHGLNRVFECHWPDAADQCDIRFILHKAVRKGHKDHQVAKNVTAFRWMARMRDAEKCDSIRTLIGWPVSCSSFVSFLARMRAYVYRHIQTRAAFDDNECEVDPFQNLYNTLMSWVRSGVFEKIPVTWIPDRTLMLQATMELPDLPELYARIPPNRVHSKQRYELTDEIVDALTCACKSPEEKLYIEISRATGLRASAMARMQVADIWDIQQSSPKKRIRVLEKNKKYRIVEMSDSLKSCVEIFIRGTEQCSTQYIFGQFALRRGPHVTRRILWRLCDRVGIKRAYHHAWRSYIVSTCVSRGVPIDVVSRWIGHASSEVTMKYYLSKAQTDMAIRNALQPSDNSNGNNNIAISGNDAMWQRLREMNTALDEAEAENHNLRTMLTDKKVKFTSHLDPFDWRN